MRLVGLVHYDSRGNIPAKASSFLATGQKPALILLYLDISPEPEPGLHWGLQGPKQVILIIHSLASQSFAFHFVSSALTCFPI